jgi:ATP-dependent Lhr-like helicase
MEADDLEFLRTVPPAAAAVAALDGPIREWFAGRFGGPTQAQRLAWPAVAAGKSLLLSAPTGGGKTLAAFLPVLARLRESPAGGVRCLYVAPLKALVNDVFRNLRETVDGLPAGPEIRIGLRTGDTPAAVRRLMLREPPDIWLTTPESLAVVLSQPAAAEVFGSVRWVVVDEVHALAAKKRGADLSVSLERVGGLAPGPVQRLGLSATCCPLTEAARFLAGVGRPCAIAEVPDQVPLQLTVEPLDTAHGFLNALLDRLRPELDRNRTTLIFTNTRGLAERLTWAVRRSYPTLADRIGIHHSSLALGCRREVEERLKRGELRAVVSSTSLELGIDVGCVDGIVLVHPPGGVVRLLQRLGRSGHGPGRRRRGLVLTATPAELLEAAVTGASGRAEQCEPLRVPAPPLDVLCQQLLGMAAQSWWTPDEAYRLVRSAYPYRNLPRADFDDCVNYLAGRHRDGRDWLPSRLRWDGDRFAVRDTRTARVLRCNVGTILTDEPRRVIQTDRDGEALTDPATPRRSDVGPSEPGGATVGEVDEAFAERLQPGDRILLFGRSWEVQEADGPELRVREALGRPAVPKWTADGWPLSEQLAERLYLLRAQAAEALRDGPVALEGLLRDQYGLEESAARLLGDFFEQQECMSEVPDGAVCLVEVVGAEYYVHTPLNRRANDALARVAARRLARDDDEPASSVVADLGFVLSLRGETVLTADDFRGLMRADRFDADLAEAVADSITLRERFRRVATTGLMVLRNPLGGRRRVGGADWAERRLFSRVLAADPDFVLLRQARREVWESCCDREAALRFVESVQRMAVRVRRLAAVSPFAAAWTQPAAGPAETVDTPARALERLHAVLTGAERAG